MRNTIKEDWKVFCLIIFIGLLYTKYIYTENILKDVKNVSSIHVDFYEPWTETTKSQSLVIKDNTDIESIMNLLSQDIYHKKTKLNKAVPAGTDDIISLHIFYQNPKDSHKVITYEIRERGNINIIHKDGVSRTYFISFITRSSEKRLYSALYDLLWNLDRHKME
ncbi:hypothetical protein ACTNDY_10515 [Tissierellaceae bacterium HCP3S3_D8]